MESNAKAGLLQKPSDSTLKAKDELSVELLAGKELNPWFTSLWTLQEVCLRPDMICCDADLNPLCVADSLRPLSLHDVESLVNDESLKHDALTKPAQDLTHRFWDASTHFKGVWNPFTIIKMSNQRYCEARRAEAIMSVVGATEWFMEWMQQNSDLSADPKVMVAGKYPMAFVEEMRMKYGSGKFFSAATLKRRAIKWILDDRYEPGTPGSIGSMLPVGEESIFIPASDFLELNEDPLSAKWTIQADGTVSIEEAFVHLSQNDAPLETMEAKITLTSIVPSQDKFAEPLSGNLASLQEWSRSFKPEAKFYAVRIKFDDFHSEGVLLKEVQSGRFLMVGLFALTRQPDTPWPGRKEKLDLVVL